MLTVADCVGAMQKVAARAPLCPSVARLPERSMVPPFRVGKHGTLVLLEQHTFEMPPLGSMHCPSAVLGARHSAPRYQWLGRLDGPAACLLFRKETAGNPSGGGQLTGPSGYGEGRDCQPIRARGAEQPAERATSNVGEAHRFGGTTSHPRRATSAVIRRRVPRNERSPYSSGLAGSDVSPIR